MFYNAESDKLYWREKQNKQVIMQTRQKDFDSRPATKTKHLNLTRFSHS